MLFDMRLTVEELSAATEKQRIAHDLYGDGETPLHELDPLIGAKSGRAVAMRLVRMRQRLGLSHQRPRPRRRCPVYFHQLSMFDGL